MNTEKALLFLSQHQPLPADSSLSQDIIDKYDEIRRFFINKPDERAIGLFLRSYGDGDGWGVYPLVEDFFYKCSPDDVKKEIKVILEDVNIADSVRYWVTQLSAVFSDEILRAGLEISLKSKNEDIKEAAEMSISILDEYK